MPESPIILNEREARKARAALTRIDKLLSSNTYVSAAQGSLPTDVLGMHQNALRGSRKALVAMLDGYEKAQSGEFSIFAEKWRSEPGVVLIIARIARGLSQAELATRLGMREQQIQRYESERYRSISLQNFKRVATALSVELQAIANRIGCVERRKGSPGQAAGSGSVPLGANRSVFKHSAPISASPCLRYQQPLLYPHRRNRRPR